ncbi:hypothetical protein Tco_0459544 [Tanacetum coccineum]
MQTDSSRQSSNRFRQVQSTELQKHGDERGQIRQTTDRATTDLDIQTDGISFVFHIERKVIKFSKFPSSNYIKDSAATQSFSKYSSKRSGYHMILLSAHLGKVFFVQMGVSVHLSEDLFGFWLDGSTFFVTNGSTAVGGECGRFCGGSASMGNAGFGTTVSNTKSGLFEVIPLSKWN